jgi:hypothetical protein
MTEVTQPTYARRPLQRTLPADRAGVAGGGMALCVLGALGLLAMGAVHLYEYFADYFRVVPVIGPLFVLNFAGATVTGLLLLRPFGRNRAVDALLAAGGIAMAVCSIVFLLVSEHTPVFGFAEYGYRAAIVVALAAEAAATVFLGGYLATQLRRG